MDSKLYNTIKTTNEPGRVNPSSDLLSKPASAFLEREEMKTQSNFSFLEKVENRMAFGTYENLLDTFCQKVSGLKEIGIEEEDAKAVVKAAMNKAIDMMNDSYE